MKRVAFSIFLFAVAVMGCGDSDSNTSPDFTCALDAVVLPQFNSSDPGHLWGHCSKFVRKPDGVMVIASKSPIPNIYDLYQEYTTESHANSDGYQDFSFYLSTPLGLLNKFWTGDTIYFLAYPMNGNTHYEYSTPHLKWSGLGAPSNILSVVWK